MHPIKLCLLKILSENMPLYSRIADTLVAYLVTDYDHVRKVNDDGVFTLARALEGPQSGAVELHALLLAATKQSMKDYHLLCNMIHDSIVIENKARKSKIIDEEEVLLLANALKPFKAKTDFKYTDSMMSREDTLDLCLKNSQIPNVLASLLSKPGVSVSSA